VSRWRHRLRVLEAAVLLAAYALVVQILPLRRLLTLAGIPIVPSTQPSNPSPYAEGLAVGRAVEAAARRLPWHPLCLPQATVAGLMLRLRGRRPSMCFGVRRADEGLSAHAWLILDGAEGGIVVGGRPVGDLVPFSNLPGSSVK
jgi:hypothetical protein